MVKKIFLFCLLTITVSSFGQTIFNKGVNLTNWFQANSARQIQFSKFTRQDLVNIKSLGCDVIRLPINLHYMTNGSPDYILDPLFFEFLDQVVGWAEELQINLILDNHTFDPSEDTDPNVGNVLVKVWKQMATHYKDRSEYVYYEILNEPHGITTQQWGQIQQSAINAIRSVDTKHTIIVGASGFNSYSELKNLPVYTDPKLIYTFHFYDPFLFTHQGATWVNPSMAPLAGMPFPYEASGMPSLPATLKGSWIENSFNNYATDGTVAKVKSLIDIAVNFKTSRNVKVFCGEFGVYIPNSNNNDRIFWYDTVRKYLEEKGIPWTIWDYTGGFGIFKKGSNEMFDYDVNTELINALGMNVPAQKTYILRADSVGFPVFTDIIEKDILGSGSGSGITDFYNALQPNNGKYCIYWTDAPQYNNIAFDFKPDKDLSRLVNEGYALDFMVRGNSNNGTFDIRFIDSKTGDSDHPWRMRVTIDNSYGPWDKYWHHVRIPLSSFKEHGSWDNGTWYNPEGKFDWKAVDRMEIVSEAEAMTGKPFWFDNIHITNRDTAVVRETDILNRNFRTDIVNAFFQVFPNPMNNHLNISYNLERTSDMTIDIYSLSGLKIYSYVSGQTPGQYMLQWNGCDQAGRQVPSGIYLIRFSTGQGQWTHRIFKN